MSDFTGVKYVRGQCLSELYSFLGSSPWKAEQISEVTTIFARGVGLHQLCSCQKHAPRLSMEGLKLAVAVARPPLTFAEIGDAVEGRNPRRNFIEREERG